MHRCIFFVLISLTGNVAFAQYTISGTVHDAMEKQALPGVNVWLEKVRRGSTTDTEGNFRITDLPSGTHVLSVTYIGRKSVLDTIDLQSDLSLDFFLSEDTTEFMEPVMIHATRAGESTPTTFVNVNRETLQRQNFGQDMPILLNWTPSVVTTSDAGTGIGYTGIRIRGSDATRVNVTINGIPYNDSESQSTYWVDIPDIASSTQSVQIQRGVGTSTNGAGAFGASVNVETKSNWHGMRYAELVAAGGSFATQRYTARAGTGYLGGSGFYLEGKASKILSDGYVDRAGSDLASYYASIGFDRGSTSIQAIAFGGSEKTYQSWYGVDEATLQTNRTMNYAGALYDASGKITGYYDNQVDDYKQDHLQLHFSHSFSTYWKATAALHTTFGRGFYEEYQQDRSFASVGLPDFSTTTSSDMIVRKWLDNRFSGITYDIQYNGKKSSFLLGGAVNQYSPAKHFGEITWVQVAGSVSQGYRYYDGQSEKGDRNVFIKWNFKLNNRLSSFIDLQYRGVNYTTSGTRDDQRAYAVNDRFDFFNPKVGLSYTWKDNNTFYASYAIANREPNRSDYLEGSTKPRSERLHNLEAGMRKKTEKYALDVNYFLMQYKDQLVQTGAIDNAGSPIRANVGNSYRTGVEVSGTIQFSTVWSWNANATWSVNQNKDFIVFENNMPVPKNTKIILSPGLVAGSQLSWKPLTRMEAAWLSKYVGTQYLDNTESTSVRLSDYWINDLRLSYEIPLKGFKSIGWSVLINNVLDVMYSSNGYSYSGVPYYFPQAGRNFMTMMTIKF